MEGFDDIQLRYSSVRPEVMSEYDIEVLNRVVSKLTQILDPTPIVNYMYQHNLIDQSFYNDFCHRVHQEGVAEFELCQYFFDKLPRLCSMRTLVDALRETGHADISKMMVESWMLSKTSTVTRVYRCDASTRVKVQQFFKKLKRMVWNADCDDPLECLRNIAENLTNRMARETNYQRKLVLSDQIGAVLSAEIDAHAITFNTELSHHFLFQELENLVPNTSNTNITDVILYGRLANACAIGRLFDKAENYLQKAKGCSAFMTPCLELANMIYCEVYVKLWEFEQMPSEQIRRSLIQMAEVGIECLREEEEEIKLLWTRMFLLRMTFCILGIGNRANIIKGSIITEGGISKAKELLAVLDQTLDNMDKRRKMFYHMARGRLCHILGDIESAWSYIDKSLRLSEIGNFKEKSFIAEYKNTIEAHRLSPSHSWNNLYADSLENQSPGESFNSMEQIIVFRNDEQSHKRDSSSPNVDQKVEMSGIVSLPVNASPGHLSFSSFEKLVSSESVKSKERVQLNRPDEKGQTQFIQRQSNATCNPLAHLNISCFDKIISEDSNKSRKDIIRFDRNRDEMWQTKYIVETQDTTHVSSVYLNKDSFEQINSEESEKSAAKIIQFERRATEIGQIYISSQSDPSPSHLNVQSFEKKSHVEKPDTTKEFIQLNRERETPHANYPPIQKSEAHSASPTGSSFEKIGFTERCERKDINIKITQTNGNKFPNATTSNFVPIGSQEKQEVILMVDNTHLDENQRVLAMSSNSVQSLLRNLEEEYEFLSDEMFQNSSNGEHVKGILVDDKGNDHPIVGMKGSSTSEEFCHVDFEDANSLKLSYNSEADSERNFDT